MKNLKNHRRIADGTIACRRREGRLGSSGSASNKGEFKK